MQIYHNVVIVSSGHNHQSKPYKTKKELTDHTGALIEVIKRKSNHRIKIKYQNQNFKKRTQENSMNFLT